ncbi:hypothetical protein RHGRI_037908 [Rhododendron griersonianum]|uniref:Uncharacterized protein n=1 Tax=Rhododendron griersonianum TaxID=479676 RepID=A0AAV6HWX4_9ERIC|nr:hypothetical protein RHGRI_037908 [Rhododendron griersonianum]
MMGEEAENGRVRRETFGTQKRRRSEFIVYCNEDKQSISQGGRRLNGIQVNARLTRSFRRSQTRDLRMQNSLRRLEANPPEVPEG